MFTESPGLLTLCKKLKFAIDIQSYANFFLKNVYITFNEAPSVFNICNVSFNPTVQTKIGFIDETFSLIHSRLQIQNTLQNVIAVSSLTCKRNF